jgi:hypothetical protein
MNARGALTGFAHNLGGEQSRRKIFYFFRSQLIEKSRFRQINPSNFAWIYLDLLGPNSRSG